jgi:hypothetical protein
MQRARSTPAGKAARNSRARGRFQTINAFLDVHAASMPPLDSLVWLMLWRDEKTDGLVRVGFASLAKRCGRSRDSIKRAVRRLRAGGYVHVVRKGTSASGPSTYRLALPHATRGNGAP